MKKMNSIKNKKVTVLGAGISGIGASSLAAHLGAKVTLIDENKKLKIQNLEKIKIIVGKNTNQIIDADIIVVSPGIDLKNKKIFKIINKKNIPVIGEIEFGSWFTNSKIIGITGSNGKSTVVNIIFSAAKKKFKNTMLGGNIGVSFCSNVLKEIKKRLENTIHILELSSFQLEKIFHFNPEIGCILNISKDHLDRYKNFEEYYNTKFKIYNKKNITYYNQNDKILNKEFRLAKNAIPFSIKNDPNYKVKNNCILIKNNDKKLIELNKTTLLGKHNIENILAAVHILKKIMISDSTIQDTIYNFSPLNHRLEKIIYKNSPLFINDSKGTNIFSTNVAINCFTKNIILILGGYKDDNLNTNDLIKTINRKKIEIIICYGQIGEYIHNIIKNYKKTEYIKDFKKAILYSINIAKSKNVILFSPGFKSYDQFKNFEERGNEYKSIINNYYN